MDVLPAEIHCEAPTQDVLLTIDGKVDEQDYSAFMNDLRRLNGGWTLVSGKAFKGQRTFVVRAHYNVTYNAIIDATANAASRGWTTHVTFDVPRCNS